MTKKKEYYLITYVNVRHRDRYCNIFNQAVTDKEPAEWLLKCLKDYGDTEIYYLVYTQKITKEVYLKMKELF